MGAHQGQPGKPILFFTFSIQTDGWEMTGHQFRTIPQIFVENSDGKHSKVNVHDFLGFLKSDFNTTCPLETPAASKLIFRGPWMLPGAPGRPRNEMENNTKSEKRKVETRFS